jgi:hypothetical protein
MHIFHLSGRLKSPQQKLENVPSELKIPNNGVYVPIICQIFQRVFFKPLTLPFIEFFNVFIPRSRGFPLHLLCLTPGGNPHCIRWYVRWGPSGWGWSVEVCQTRRRVLPCGNVPLFSLGVRSNIMSWLMTMGWYDFTWFYIRKSWYDLPHLCFFRNNRDDWLRWRAYFWDGQVGFHHSYFPFLVRETRN